MTRSLAFPSDVAMVQIFMSFLSESECSSLGRLSELDSVLPGLALSSSAVQAGPQITEAAAELATPATSAAPHTALDPGSPRSQGSFNIFNLSPHDFSLSPMHRGHNDSQQVQPLRRRRKMCSCRSYASAEEVARRCHLCLGLARGACISTDP